MSSLLFIAPADLGETVLATGALAFAVERLQSPKLTIVCEPGAIALFSAAPGLEALFDRHASWTDSVAMSWRLANRTFDLAIDFGPSPTLLLGAKRRVRPRSGAALQHLAQAFASSVGAEQTLAPKLWLTKEARAAGARASAGAGPLLVLAPGGANASKRWPVERFAAVARRLASGPLIGARIIVLGAGARDQEITRMIAASLDADGLAARGLGGEIDLLAASALLEGATLCVGNDNALTHISAASGAPTLTLFGPTDERVRAPCGPRTRTLRGRSFEEIAIEAHRALDDGALMHDISVDAVEAAAADLLRAGGLG